MGTLYPKPHPDLLQDLKVTVHSSSMVFPSQETKRKSMFLSNIDQVLTFDVQTIHFFPAHGDFPPQVVAEKIRDTLGKILVDYEYLAGRLKLNAETGRLEIDCDASGAGFVEASSEYCLDEVGDLVYPNPAFGQLVDSTNLDMFKQDDRPLCILQVINIKTLHFESFFFIILINFIVELDPSTYFFRWSLVSGKKKSYVIIFVIFFF